MKTNENHHLRPGAEQGFTLIVALGVLLVSSLLMTAAFVAAEGDIHLTQSDQAAKRAYYAALAGVQDYEYHLTQDGNYLNYCTTPSPANPALNQAYKEGTKTPLKLRTQTGRSAGLRRPAASSTRSSCCQRKATPKTFPKCNTSNVVESMIEQKLGRAAGTFRLASTGFAEGKKRTIVATFKNLNFVSYVWYTVYETGDSALYDEPRTRMRALLQRTASVCCQTSITSSYAANPSTARCTPRTMVGSAVNRNSVATKTTGSNSAMATKKKKGKGYDNEGRCEAAKPKIKGKLIPPNETLSIKPPPGDEELEHIVETSPKNYKFEGKTEIILTGETMTVTEHVGSHPNAEESRRRKERSKNHRRGVPAQRCDLRRWDMRNQVLAVRP